MKFCSKCGKEINDEAVVCIHCGCSTTTNKMMEKDAPDMGFAILGFLIPLVGLILYLIYKDQAPLKAKSAGKGALISFCIGLFFSVIYGIAIMGMTGALDELMGW